jgi:hypothetical protein
LKFCIVPRGDAVEAASRVKPLLARALAHGGTHGFRDLQKDLGAGQAQLWLAWDGNGPQAAAVTTITNYPLYTECLIWLCAGDGRDGWLHGLEGIEAWAKGRGCATVAIQGRAGWKRVLDGYSKKAVLLEKRLT